MTTDTVPFFDFVFMDGAHPLPGRVVTMPGPDDHSVPKDHPRVIWLCLLTQADAWITAGRLTANHARHLRALELPIEQQQLYQFGRPFTRKCRECGCTDKRACATGVTGQTPCHWVESDLCSSCDTANHAAPIGPCIELKETDIAALTSLPTASLEFNGINALRLLLGIQLLLRHPKVQGPVRDTFFSVAVSLHEHLSVTPTLTTLCEAGWNPDKDHRTDVVSQILLQ